MTPLFWVKNHESFGFFNVEPKRFFRVLTPWGLYVAEWNKRFVQFSPFAAIFAMWAVLATSVNPWYPL